MSDTLQIRDRREHPFYTVDNRIITEYGRLIGAYGIAIYNALAYHAGRNDHAWPSLRTLADETGMSRRSVIRTVELLVTHGLIRKEPRQGDQGAAISNLYTLIDLPAPMPHSHPPVTQGHSPMPHSHQGSATQSPDLVSQGHGGSDCVAHKEETIEEETIEEETSEEEVVSACAETPPTSWDEWLMALCWICHSHQDPAALSEKERGALTAEAKRMRDAGYANLDHLRGWFQDVWKATDWRWQQGKQRPDPAQVRAGLAAYAHQRAELATLTEESIMHRRPKPAPPPPPATDPWSIAVQEMATQMPAGLLERAASAPVGSLNEAEVWEITLDPQDANDFGWMRTRGAALIRRTLSSILHRPVLVNLFLLEPANPEPAD